MAPLFTELADQWRLSVSDPVVTRVLIGWAPTLQVAIPDGLLEIKVEAPFVVSAESATLELEPAGDPQLLGPALAVVRKRLHSGPVYEMRPYGMRRADRPRLFGVGIPALE